MHQVNVEYLARVVMVEDGWAFPDVCLGTDSHTRWSTASACSRGGSAGSRPRR